jgi:hypothetical protein
MPNVPSDLFGSRGPAYDKPAAVSHYNDPILTSKGTLAGNSRIWGDAPIATQTAAINALTQAAAAQNLTTGDTALLLSIVRYESGFNPDAAAGTTSASGLGQFTDSTGAGYGITASNRWDISAQIKATVDYFVAVKNKAATLGLDSSHIYALWHDGINSKGYGPGFAYSQADVMPKVGAFQTYLESENFPDHGGVPKKTSPQSAPALIGKTPAEMARYLADQARADAAKNLGLSNMQMYDVAMSMAASMPSFAPVPGRGARPAKFTPRRLGAGDAAALTDTSCVMDASGTLAARPEGGREQGVTGIRAGDATMRGAEFLRGSGRELSRISFAPVGPRGAPVGLGLRAANRAGGIVGRFITAAAGDSDGAPLSQDGNGHPGSIGPGAAHPHQYSGLHDKDGARHSAASPAVTRAETLDIDRALNDYFYQQSRLPPRGGSAFNSLLSPMWAGLKLPD